MTLSEQAAMPEPKAVGRGIAGDLHVSGLHALLRKDGAFIVWRETAKKRLVAKLKAIKLELKHRRHEPTASVGAWLQKVTSGYYQFHAVPGNLPRLQLFRWRLSWIWWSALSRRSKRSGSPWTGLTGSWTAGFQFPRVLYPYPMQRFNARYPRREPDA